MDDKSLLESIFSLFIDTEFSFRLLMTSDLDLNKGENFKSSSVE